MPEKVLLYVLTSLVSIILTLILYVHKEAKVRSEELNKRLEGRVENVAFNRQEDAIRFATLSEVVRSINLRIDTMDHLNHARYVELTTSLKDLAHDVKQLMVKANV